MLPTQIGERAELAVMAALVETGKELLVPFFGNAATTLPMRKKVDW